jgi:hypothetical protein
MMIRMTLSYKHFIVIALLITLISHSTIARPTVYATALCCARHLERAVLESESLNPLMLSAPNRWASSFVAQCKYSIKAALNSAARL